MNPDPWNDEACDELQQACRDRDAKIVELEAKVSELERRAEEKTAEFNAGYDAAVAGLPPDEPLDTKHGQWMVGYAWGKWLHQDNDHIAELERRLAMATGFILADDTNVILTPKGRWMVYPARDGRIVTYDSLGAALAAAEENRDGR